jgi:hypothetical protein
LVAAGVAIGSPGGSASAGESLGVWMGLAGGWTANTGAANATGVVDSIGALLWTRIPETEELEPHEPESDGAGV